MITKKNRRRMLREHFREEGPYGPHWDTSLALKLWMNRLEGEGSVDEDGNYVVKARMNLWNPLTWISLVFGIVVVVFDTIYCYILEIPKMIGAKTTIRVKKELYEKYSGSQK